MKAIAICALAASTQAASQDKNFLQKWNEYEAPKLTKSTKNRAKALTRGQMAQHKMQETLLAHGYPYSSESKERLRKQGKLHPRLMVEEETIEGAYYLFSLGFARGAQYKDTEEGPCYQVKETNIYTQMFMFDEILTKLEQPEKWAEMLIYTQSLIEIQAQQFEVCQTNEIINNLATLFTVEGFSTLFARMFGSSLVGFDNIFDGLIEAANENDSEQLGI